jgi:hypothetical protein
LTIGACTIEAGTDLVKCASFDIDNHTGTENIIPEIQKLYDACIKAGLHPIIESSSGDNVNDGCHILFPCNPTKASIIRKMLKPVLDSTGFNHEVNPKQDHVEPDKFGNQVKLIWQYNNRTGKRSTIINPETMLAFSRDEAIKHIMSCPDNVFHEIPGREPPTPPITEAPEQSSVSIKSEMSFDEQFGLKNIKPCIVKAYNDKWMLHGKGDEGHNFRIAIAGNLFYNGATDQQAHDFFSIQDDYTERTTHLQLETIHKYLSSGRRPTGCKTIMEKCKNLLNGMCATCSKKPKQVNLDGDEVKNAIEKGLIEAWSNSLELTEQFQKATPVYYDISKNFWIWNGNEKYYFRCDETDILSNLHKKSGEEVWESTKKREIVECIKITGRRREVKECPKTWIHTYSGIVDYIAGNAIAATPDYFLTSPIPHKIGNSDSIPTIDKLFTDWLGLMSTDFVG